MPLPVDLPIVDHHCHLSPHGEGVRAAARFRSAGGTHLFLATQNYVPDVPLDLEAYQHQFEVTEALAHRIRADTGVVVYCVVAPYPVDLIGAAERIGLPAAIALYTAALELAGRWVRERRAVAIGEVGRPHFDVADPRVRRASEDLFDLALSVARDADCPAIVHCEELSVEEIARLGRRARAAGLPPVRLVKHYARARFPAPSPERISASYLAKRELVGEVLLDQGPWFLETDFLDDPKRPGAVLDLATVPRRARWVAETRPDQVERLRIPFEEAIRAVYGWSPERDERSGA
ncbi:MAG: TatD family hydrolase [Thermoplasmatales archaeon]|nr:TatD family hydrolase [Thermoplasmatales archaeon]